MKLPKELREKSDLSGTASKAKICSVIECGESAIRSLSENKWSKVCEKARLKLNENRLRKIFLCKKERFLCQTMKDIGGKMQNFKMATSLLQLFLLMLSKRRFNHT